MKLARKTTEADKPLTLFALTVSIEIDPLVEVVRRHVKLSARATRLIEGDFARLLRGPRFAAPGAGRRGVAAGTGHLATSDPPPDSLVLLGAPAMPAPFGSPSCPNADRPPPTKRSDICARSLNYACNRHWVDDAPLLRHNPVDVLKYSWHPTKARSERIPCDRIGAVWQMLTAQARAGSAARGERTAAAFVQFLILTGARLREACELTWDRLSLDGPLPSWCIHPEQSKTGAGRLLPLSAQAVAVLFRQPHVAGNAYVFASRDGKSHVVQPGATWRAVSREAGVHVPAHSMRRTFTNTCLKLGIEMWKTEMLTSHVPTTTTLLHYTDTADLRESCSRDVQMLANWIEAQARDASFATGSVLTKVLTADRHRARR